MAMTSTRICQAVGDAQHALIMFAHVESDALRRVNCHAMRGAAAFVGAIALIPDGANPLHPFRLARHA
jgi:hypothetical protein